MKILIVLLEVTQQEKPNLVGPVAVLIAIAVILITFILKKIKSYNRKKEEQYTQPLSSTIKSRETKIHTETFVQSDRGSDESSVDEEDEGAPFDREIKRLRAVEWDVSYENQNFIVPTTKGLYFLSNDNELFLDDVEIDEDLSTMSEIFITPSGEVYYSSSETCSWHRLGEEDSFWVDYVKFADDDDVVHPDGVIEYDDDISLNDEVLYSGDWDSFSCHPNFGVIVENESQVFINQHLQYEGFYEGVYPDPEGIIIVLGNDYYLIPKNLPTPVFSGAMSEDDYSAMINNNDHEFVTRRIFSVYKGRLIQKDFVGNVWKSQAGLLFRPSDESGKLYLRDKLLYEAVPNEATSKDPSVTNVVIDGEKIFIQVDDIFWYYNKNLFFSENECYNNYYGSMEDIEDGEDALERWPDGTTIQSAGKFSSLLKNGIKFFNASIGGFYMHPQGVVVVDENEEQVIFIPF